MNENSTVQKSNEELSNEIKGLQLKANIGKVMILAGFGAGSIAIYKNVIPLAVAFFVIMVAGGYITKKFDKEIKQVAGNGILKQVLDESFKDVTYKPVADLVPFNVGYAGFNFAYNDVEQNDYVKATYKGYNFEMCGIGLLTHTTDSDGTKQDDYDFRGLWAIIDANRKVSADVCIQERSKLGKMLNKGGIQTENDLFNRRFYVTSANESEALKVLTPSLMEYIVTVSDNTKTKINISFLENGKVHIALNANKDAFKVKGTMSNTETIKEQFVNEINQMTDIIDKVIA